MNALSSTLEQMFIRQGIPYRIIGGLKFFDRKEVKDILAYLAVLNNPDDSLRLRRIINEPKRGIGEATMNTAQQVAEAWDNRCTAPCKRPRNMPLFPVNPVP